MTQAHMGLRELKKQATRETIASAALKLTRQKGVNRVTINEIAHEAFVSSRRVTNYFPTKEGAVLAGGKIGYDAILAEYSQSSAQGHPLEVLRDIFYKYVREHPEHFRMGAQLIHLEQQNPTLKPFRVAQRAELITTLGESIAVRTNTDVETDPYPSLVAAAAVMAMSTSLTIWSRSNSEDGGLTALVDESFKIIIEGYPLIPPEVSD